MLIASAIGLALLLTLWGWRQGRLEIASASAAGAILLSAYFRTVLKKYP